MMSQPQWGERKAVAESLKRWGAVDECRDPFASLRMTGPAVTRYFPGVNAACVVATGSSSPRKYLALSFDPAFRSAAFMAGMAS